MPSLAFRNLRVHFRRTLAIIVATVLGVAFFSAAMMSGTVIRESIRTEVGRQLRGAELIARSEFGPVDPEIANLVQGVEGVRVVEPVESEYGEAVSRGTSSIMRFGPLSDLPEIRDGMTLKQGQLPSAPDEIALTEWAAASLGVGLDDTLAWTPFAVDRGEPAQFRVVGILHGGNVFGASVNEGLMTGDAFGGLDSDSMVNAIVIQVAEGADIRDVQARLAGIVPDDVEVMTFAEMMDAEVTSLEQGSNVLTYGLVAFALIALFVAGLVIANTFSITLTQRTHELAMLRCIGAEKRQIHRSVIFEALVLGVISSLLGVLAGYGIVSAGAFAFLSDSNGVALSDVSVWALVLPVTIGTAVTVLSAIVPARHATTVHPLQALRRTDAPIEAVSTGLFRVVVPVLLIGGGGALLLGGMALSLAMEDGAPAMPLLIGMAGGALSFIGLLMAAVFVVPLGVRGLGFVTGVLLGVPARIATSNATRNPRRTASTSAALMVGVVLITMMTVGAATVQATWNDVIDQQAPIDLYVQQSIQAPDTLLPRAIYDGFGTVDGVAVVAPIHAQPVRILVGGQEFEETAVGIAPSDGRAVSRSTGLFDGFEDGILLVPTALAEGYGVGDGDRAAVSRNGRAIELEVRTARIADWEVYLSLDDARQLTPDVPMTGAWIRLDDDASVKDVVRAISDGIPAGESISIHGGAKDRATYLEIVDQMLLIVSGLLGVAVVIAVVGVGNTLTLSVLERTRESGMLRAMGLTARQLRGTLAIEGVMIALVGGVLGLVAGAIYGWIGAVTLFGSSWDVTLGFPVGRLSLILAVAIVAGMLASVLPGRRAVSTSPVAALATV